MKQSHSESHGEIFDIILKYVAIEGSDDVNFERLNLLIEAF